MKDCDNSTRKIHISSNFILSISLLIMFDTLLLRPSLHCNTPLHFTTLHTTTISWLIHSRADGDLFGTTSQHCFIFNNITFCLTVGLYTVASHPNNILALTLQISCLTVWLYSIFLVSVHLMNKRR